MIGRIDEVVIDCAEPAVLARFWSSVHLDVAVTDIPTATERAEALGAHRTGDLHVSSAVPFQVLLDPEGNEWCLVAPA